jgi:hypothetical protein
MAAFEAQYGGRCGAACGTAIAPGDQVVYVDDVLVHEGCEEGALLVALLDAPAKPRVVCGSCFLEKPCPCDDGQGPG